MGKGFGSIFFFIHTAKPLIKTMSINGLVFLSSIIPYADSLIRFIPNTK